MSGASVAAKINKAMGKVSKKIGFTCRQYRPDVYADPIDNRNEIATMQVAWSVDESFVKNPVDELAHYLVYVSGDVVQLGDIFVCDEPSTTLIITDLDPMRVPAGIRADDRMNVYRSSFVGGDKKTELVMEAHQVPCAIKIGKASAVGTPNTTMRSGMTSLDIWTWMPVQDVQIGDVVETLNTRFLVTSVNSSVKGTKITANSMKAGQ